MLLTEAQVNSNKVSQSVPLVTGMTSSWLEVCKDALTHNIAQYKQIIGQTKKLAVVIKSNAYGHGLINVAQICEQNVYVDWLCTANLSEALLLRRQGITKPILVLSYLDAEVEAAVAYDIAVVLYDSMLIAKLQCAAERYQRPARVHIKVDTGLSRLGLLPEQAFELCYTLRSYSAIYIEGIFTHFAESEKWGKGFTEQQVMQFDVLWQRLVSAQIQIPYRHYSCTAALTVVEDTSYTFARFGLGLYGLWPSTECKQITMDRYPELSLQPVLTWKTKIVQLKRIPAGSYVGYGRTHQVIRDTLLAILPIGYWEGYDRDFSNNSVVVVRGQTAPVVGRVSMNITMIDVTDVPCASIEDEVILLGDHPAVSADALAARLGTINWEVVTRINPLLPRIVV